jgi:hypothetical protein
MNRRRNERRLKLKCSMRNSKEILTSGNERDTNVITHSLIRILVLSVALVSFNGCSMFKGQMEPMGIRDWVECPVGTVVTGVPLPTDEPNKKYNIVVSKPSALVSLDGLNRMGK